MARALHFVATSTRGIEEVLAEELRGLGMRQVKPQRGAVEFQGRLRDGYRAVLWSRLASRIFLRLGRAEVHDADGLYAGAREVAWEDHIDRDRTIAVSFVGKSPEIRDTRFGALKVKDAIVDRLRDQRGVRPDVDAANPDVPIHVYLDHSVATFSLDLCGAPLHLRGGGGRMSGAAPLRETLAAALLLFCRWPERSAAGESFYDPFCGSGTLLLEAAGIAQQRAPALGRESFGFVGWSGHQPDVWRELQEEARAKLLPIEEIPNLLAGGDVDRRSIRDARANFSRLGVASLVEVVKGDMRSLAPPPDAPPGLLVANPPYGERLGDPEALMGLYQEFGDRLRREFLGWHAGVIVANKFHAGALGLKPSARRPVFNGPIECRFLEFPISAKPPEKSGPGWRS